MKKRQTPLPSLPTRTQVFAALAKQQALRQDGSTFSRSTRPSEARVQFQPRVKGCGVLSVRLGINASAQPTTDGGESA